MREIVKLVREIVSVDGLKLSTFIKFEYGLISRTSYCPRLISLLVVGGEKTSLGGEYVGGEIVPWWRVRWW